MNDIKRTFWNDVLIRETVFGKNKTHKEWYKNGSKKSEYYFLNDLIHGLNKYWRNSKGDLWYVNTWKLNNMHGIALIFQYEKI